MSSSLCYPVGQSERVAAHVVTSFRLPVMDQMFARGRQFLNRIVLAQTDGGRPCMGPMLLDVTWGPGAKKKYIDGWQIDPANPQRHSAVVEAPAEMFAPGSFNSAIRFSREGLEVKRGEQIRVTVRNTTDREMVVSACAIIDIFTHAEVENLKALQGHVFDPRKFFKKGGS